NIVAAGVFGANGSLIIGGSGSNTISANTLLQLYAPGSNGLLKFVANVTLSSGTAMDLAANTITINPGVTVTIAGNGGPANVYTGSTNSVPNANYTGFGGNGSTTGTFAGNGANNPQPLANAPAFDPPASSSASSGTPRVGNQISPSSNITSSSKATGSTINVGDSGQLLSLLNSSATGTGGKITVSNTANRSRNSRAANPAERSGPSTGAKNVQSSAGVQQFPATVAALPRTQ
ncbi:MAG TPA: hypothetical protein VNX27_06275, partial [Chthoniobacterales bacterium]|nr:hypothetical protein [Chthoniobacterales bacterium]